MLHIRASFALFGVATTIAACTAEAQSMFRGDPAHTGTYQGGGPALVGLAWRLRTGGDVVSSPTIDGGTVYVGSDDGSLYAIELATGTQRWKTDLGSPVSSTPATGGGLVYAATRGGEVVALDASTGARRWRHRAGPLVLFPWGHESGDYYISSPTYVGRMLLVGSGDGILYALDASTGRARWRARTGGRIRSTPAVEAGNVYVGSFDGRIYCFDFATGAERWHYDTEGVSLNSGDFGYDRRSVQSSPAIMNGVVYVGARDGFLYAIDAATGERRWRFDHHISWINSSPATASGVIYAGSSDGHFLQAVDTTGRELWRATTENLVWSSPAVAGDVVYFGDGAGRLHAVDRRTGTERWVFRTAASLYSSPVVSGGYVVTGSSDGSVYALRAGAGPAIERAVFYDTTLFQSAHVTNGTAARFLAARGYRTLDSAGLLSFLKRHAVDHAPSVAVFALDYLPDRAIAGPANGTLLRRYLDAGGKVVWMGPPPAVFPAQMPPGKIVLDWPRSTAITGVPQDSALFDNRGGWATAIGARWGLGPRWRDSWSVAPAGVTTVLGMDEWGLASAWVKNFGGVDGTGFVRVPGDDPFAIYLVAEYRGAAAR